MCNTQVKKTHRNKGIVMIGELINRFENLENQTVDQFNLLFPFSPIISTEDFQVYPDDEVEIGEIANTTRKITIRGKHFWHEINGIERHASATPHANAKAIKVYDADKNYIGEYVSINYAAYCMNLTRCQFNYRVNTGVLIMEVMGDENE